MKVNKIVTVRVLFSLIVLFGFTSCSKKSSSKNTSSATGWKINDPSGGFQYNNNFTKHKKLPRKISKMLKTKLDQYTFNINQAEAPNTTQ